jgi:hypothetical protein
LGGHVDACTECGTLRVSYNSCRNRHCPKCQGNKREKWIQARNSELLPVPYFHLVFTLPQELNPLCLRHPKEAYGILFQSVWETLRLFGQNKPVTTGMISVLHTWGQNLSLHPHLHCIVPGGGIDKNGKWKNIRVDGKFLFPVKALSKVFRAKYVSLLRKADICHKDTIKPLFSKKWVVYAKRPFAHPSHVVEYLGRYTHKVAISNSRIRHYGILSSTSKKVTIPSIREQLGAMEISFIDMRKTKPFDPKICPCCGTPTMVTVETITARGPPIVTAGNPHQVTIRQIENA